MLINSKKSARFTINCQKIKGPIFLPHISCQGSSLFFI
uniref:Uncharacterized protein n=1 Tax=Vitis vinifera TaxID=29760 RepID=F6I078_VITVI